MQRFINPNPDQWKALAQRGSASYTSLEPLAKEVFENIAQNGDQALIDYTEKFDKVALEDFSGYCRNRLLFYLTLGTVF